MNPNLKNYLERKQDPNFGKDRTKNEHLYEVSQEFQDWWVDHCNDPYKASYEKLMAWKAWKHVCDLWDQTAGK